LGRRTRSALFQSTNSAESRDSQNARSSASEENLGTGFLFFRLGLLSAAAAILCIQILDHFPITTQFSAWYSGIGLTGLALLLTFVLYAFHTSLGGRPLFGRASLED
jgi:hypothetical protein